MDTRQYMGITPRTRQSGMPARRCRGITACFRALYSIMVSSPFVASSAASRSWSARRGLGRPSRAADGLEKSGASRVPARRGKDVQVRERIREFQHAVLMQLRFAHRERESRTFQRRTRRVLVGRRRDDQIHVDNGFRGETGHRGRSDVLDLQRACAERISHAIRDLRVCDGPRRIRADDVDRRDARPNDPRRRAGRWFVVRERGDVTGRCQSPIVARAGTLLHTMEG